MSIYALVDPQCLTPRLAWSTGRCIHSVLVGRWTSNRAGRCTTEVPDDSCGCNWHKRFQGAPTPLYREDSVLVVTVSRMSLPLALCNRHNATRRDFLDTTPNRLLLLHWPVLSEKFCFVLTGWKIHWVRSTEYLFPERPHPCPGEGVFFSCVFSWEKHFQGPHITMDENKQDPHKHPSHEQTSLLLFTSLS